MSDTKPKVDSLAPAATVSKTNPSIDTSLTGSPGGKVAAEIPVPKNFGRYTIEKELGKGAMGVVYLAEDSQIGRKVALKIPRKSAIEDAEALERFYREARTAGTLRHNNICPVYDVGAIDGIHYLTMAYIPGKPVSSFVNKDKFPAPRQVALLIRKIALALAEAHKQGVVHRDLKPSNVMLDDRNEPVVMDFGLARNSNTVESARLTQSGAILGTPAYMAPEQVRGEAEEIGPHSDVYALGVMLYQFLTGELPFSGPILMVFAKILTEQPQKPSELRPDVDRALEAVCLKMMAKDTSQRFASMDEVAAALTEFLKTGTVTGLLITPAAPPPPAASPSKKSPVVHTEEQLRDLVELIEQLLLRNDYLEAIRLVGEIPDHERTAGLRRVLGEAYEMKSTVEKLERNLEKHLNQLDIPELKKTVNALLKIHPSHPRGKEIKKALNVGGKRAVAQLRNNATHFDVAGNVWEPKVIVGAVGGIVALALIAYFAVTIYLKNGKQTIAVTIDDPTATVKVDGKEVLISSQGAGEVKLTLGDHHYTVEQGGTTVRNAQHFTVSKDGQNVLTITLKEPLPSKTDDSVVGTTPATTSPPGETGSSMVPAHQVERILDWSPPLSGSTYGTLFRDRPDKSPVLIGMEVTTGRYGANYRYSAVASIKPIYRMPSGSIWKSQQYGHSGSESKEFLARDGFAIGCVKIARSSDRIVGIRFQFMRMTDGALVPEDSYWSENYLRTATDHVFESDGRLIVGIGGRYAKQEMRELEFLSLPPLHDAPSTAVAPFDADEAKAHREAWAKHLGVPVEYTNSIGMKFVLIPPGVFQMGSTDAELADVLRLAGGDQRQVANHRSETPQHKVILTQPFYLGRHEVTQAEYEKVMGKNPSFFAPEGKESAASAGMDTSRFPVEGTNWFDAVEFCLKLSQQEQRAAKYRRTGDAMAYLDGNGYRLPREAEWEFACRAGTTTRYATGEADATVSLSAWIASNGAMPHRVGLLEANPFGLHDIHGNVWEWVQDGWDEAYYEQFQNQAARDPVGSMAANPLRVSRGGAAIHATIACRSAGRNVLDAAESKGSVGFRVMLPVEALQESQTATPNNAPHRSTRPKPRVADDSNRSFTYPLNALGPLIQNVTEINSDSSEFSPWISRDGLEIFWITRERGAEPRAMYLWTAYRTAKDSPFIEKRRLFGAHSFAISADGLEMYFREDPGTAIYRATRIGTRQDFGGAAVVSDLSFPNRDPAPRWLSEDSQTLYLDLSVEVDPATYHCWQLTWGALDGRWEGLSQVMAEFTGKPNDFRFVQVSGTADHRNLICIGDFTTDSGAKAPIFGMLSRPTSTGPFTAWRDLMRSDWKASPPVLYRPYFVPATRELYFVSRDLHRDPRS